MELYSLFYGRSKKKIRTLLMTDSFQKCQNYMKARQNSVLGFHKIELAEEGSKIKKKKSCTVGGNKPTRVPHINRKGITVNSGYVSKEGFQQHT